MSGKGIEGVMRKEMAPTSIKNRLIWCWPFKQSTQAYRDKQPWKLRLTVKLQPTHHDCIVSRKYLKQEMSFKKSEVLVV